MRFFLFPKIACCRDSRLDFCRSDIAYYFSIITNTVNTFVENLFLI